VPSAAEIALEAMNQATSLFQVPADISPRILETKTLRRPDEEREEYTRFKGEHRNEMLRILGLLKEGPEPSLSAREELYERYPIYTKEGLKHGIIGLEPLSESEYQALDPKIRKEMESFFGEVHLEEMKKIETPVDARKLQKEHGLKEPFWLNPPEWAGGIAAGIIKAPVRRGAGLVGREIAAELTLGASELARALPKVAKKVPSAIDSVVDSLKRKYTWRQLTEEGAVAADLWPGQQMTAAGRRLQENIKMPKFVERTWGAPNLRRLLIPAVDDLEKEAKILFRGHRVGMAKRQEVIKEATEPLWDLTPEEHEVALQYLARESPYDVADTLGMTVDELFTPKWENARNAAAKVRNVYHRWGLEATGYSKKTGEAMLKKETYLKNLMTYLPDMAMVKEYPELFGPKLADMENPHLRKKFRADLSRFMKNKGIIKAHKEEMLQILDLKYLTTKSFGQLSQDIETAKLFQRLEELPGYVFDDMKGLKEFQSQFNEAFEKAGIDPEKGLKKIGLYSSQFKQIPDVDKALNLANKLIRSDVANVLEDQAKVASEFGRLFERLLAPWKFGKVVLRFPTHCRNIMSNWILNDIGGLPFYRLDYYTSALRQFRSKGDIYKLAKDKGLLLATFREHELLRLERSWDEKSGFIGLLSKVTKPAADLYQAEEQWFKLAKFMWHMDNEVKRGVMDIDDAVEAAMESTFDYGTSTAFQRTVKRTMMPFATWPFKSIPYMARMAVEHPVRFGKWPAMFYGVSHYSADKLLGSNQEWKRLQGQMADYQKQKRWLFLPWKDEKGRLQLIDLTYILPWGDIAELGQQGFKRVMQNPAVTIPFDLSKNRDFMDRKIVEDWERGKKEGYLKQAAYIYKQLSPSSFPGSWDWEKMMDVVGGAGRREPGVMTPKQAVLYNLGLKITPTTESFIKESFESRYDRMRSELEQKFDRDIEREHRPKERSKIRREYRRQYLGLEKEYRQLRRGQ